MPSSSASGLFPEQAVNPDDPADAWYGEAFREANRYAFNIHYNPDTRMTRLRVSAPVRDALLRPLGVVGVSIDLARYIDGIFENIPPGMEMYLFNDGGQVTAARNIRLVEGKIGLDSALGDLGRKILAGTERLSGVSAEASAIEDFDAVDAAESVTGLGRRDEFGKLANAIEHMKNRISGIRYAGRIQRNLLPNGELFRAAFRDHAVLWSPKDAVGGDGDARAGGGTFILGSRGKGYFLQTGNVIGNAKIDRIRDRIEHLNSLDGEGLRAFYRERMRAPRDSACSRDGGLGLIEIARRASSKIEYSFDPYGEGMSFFEMYVTIGGGERIMAYRFEREKTPSTPYILIDEARGLVRLEGKSFHENVTVYFQEVIEWVGTLLGRGFDGFVFECRFEYFNNSTAKLLWNLFLDMNDSDHAEKITVRWITGKDNLIVTEAGEDFKEDMERLRFEIVVE